MSASLSPDPRSLALLAVVGIGAWWFFTRAQRMQAPQVAVAASSQPVGQTDRTAQRLRAASGLLGTLGGLFGSDAPAAVPSGASDAVAFNSPVGASWDAIAQAFA